MYNRWAIDALAKQQLVATRIANNTRVRIALLIKGNMDVGRGDHKSQIWRDHEVAGWLRRRDGAGGPAANQRTHPTIQIGT